MEDNSADEQFSRYTPQHPLPDEIKKLARDDTVCKYCGVSYLIHNEIKALEDKLKATEKELATLRGQEQREELLKQENTLLKQQKTDLQASAETNTQLITSLQGEIGILKEANQKSEETATTYKKKYMTTLRQFSTLSQTVRQQRQTLIDIRQKLTDNQSHVMQDFKSCLENVKLIGNTAAKEKGELESQLQCVDMEKLVLTQSNKALTDSLKAKEGELSKRDEELQSQRAAYAKLESQLHDADALTESMNEMETSLNDVKRELESSQTQCRTLIVELDQYKMQMRTKTTELNDAVNKQKQMEQNHEVGLQKLNLEIRAKENELGSCQKQLKTLENQCREFRRKESENAQLSKLSQNEVQELQDSLQRARADTEALKAEREMMIEAHQNRIEDLRQSFKNKMAEIDNWPQKLQAAVAAEKSKHLAELKTLEENLKHNFVLELQIEKDKYNELLKKFQAQEKDKNSQRENQQALLEQKYRQEIDELNRQIDEAKKRGKEREEELGREITSLKKIINDLQDRLARLDGADSGKLTELKNELSKVQQELADNQSRITELEGKLKETKDESQFLQNVVRKECEERFELTEALSEARKELLELKKPVGGYISQKRGSLSSTHSGNISASTNSPAPLPPPEDPMMKMRPPPEDPMLKLRSQMPTNSISLSYNGGGRSSRNTSGSSIASDKNKDAQLMESRKRIANMMGRRS